MSEIFISYSRHDQGFADSLIQGLEQQGLQVWVDRVNIEGGELWRAAISRAIAQCDTMIVILSTNCVASKNVVKELSLAETHNRPILPILYQTCEIPPEMDYQLAGLQWIQFTDKPFDRALNEVVRTLQSGRVKKPSEVIKPTDAPAPPSLAASSTASAPFQSPQPQVNQPHASQNLSQILCGRWEIQISAPYVGPIGQLAVEMFPNGAFSGQMMTPVGPSTINGQWQVTPAGQLVAQGVQTVGWATSPYMAMIQFNQVSPGMLSGMSAAGEQVVWRRMA